MIEDKQVVINNFTVALRKNTASVFLGAGVSARIFDNRTWKELIQPYADKVNLQDEKDYPFIAQAYVNSGNDLSEFKKGIARSFFSNKTTEVHSICAKLPIKNFWTTNYDCAIENALKANEKQFDLIFDNNSFPHSESCRSCIVYKCHGDCNNPESLVITTDDYESYGKNNPNFISAIRNELASTTLLFLGYSFSDPDINYLLAKIKNENKNLTPHFFITKKETEKNEIMQDYKLKQYKKYGITSFKIDEYTEIETIMKEIYKQYMSYRILISGSAVDYSYFGSDERAKELIYEIGHSLVKRDLDHGIKIINGEGLGVGSFLKEGITDAVTNLGKDITNFWESHPFSSKYYLQHEKTADLEAQYKEYRKKMIDKCGVVFFIFGNKKDACGNVINADGVKKEFDIAVEKGKYVFPIASTGYMAKELADLVIKDFEKYNGDLPNIKARYLEICEKGVSNKKIIDSIFYIIDALAFRPNAR